MTQPNRKWDKRNMNRQVRKYKIKMANKHKKICTMLIKISSDQALQIITLSWSYINKINNIRY